MTLKKALEEVQGGLMLIMDAVKEGNTRGRTPSPDCRRPFGSSAQSRAVEMTCKLGLKAKGKA